jgi:hypothetical protein
MLAECVLKAKRAIDVVCTGGDEQPACKAVRTRGVKVETARGSEWAEELREVASASCGDELTWGREWTEDNTTYGAEFEAEVTWGDEWTEEQVSVRCRGVGM